MARKKYKGIVIGCGAIGALLEAEPKRPKPATHAGALSQNKATVLAALVDENPSHLSAAGKLFPRAARYTNLAECLRVEKPDIACIATGPESHRRIIETCAKAGVRAVICEKPLAASLADAKAIERAARRMVVVLNYQRRFFALFEKARREIASGALGRIQQVTGYYSNGLYNNGGHSIDALRYLLDDAIESVFAQHASRNATHPRGDFNADALLWTRKGTTIALQSLDQSKWGVHEFRILGEKGAIELGEYGYSYERTAAGPSVFAGVRQLDKSKARREYRKESMVAGALSHALECLKGTPCRSGPASGIDTLKVLDALRRSAIKGKRVLLHN